jgi:hypothetical protein
VVTRIDCSSTESFWMIWRLGRIGNGEEKRFDIPPGEHRLMMKVDWGRSGVVRCSATEGQTLEFNCGSNLRGTRLLYAIYYATLGYRNYLWLRGRARVRPRAVSTANGLLAKRKPSVAT